MTDTSEADDGVQLTVDTDLPVAELSTNGCDCSIGSVAAFGASLGLAGKGVERAETLELGICTLTC